MPCTVYKTIRSSIGLSHRQIERVVEATLRRAGHPEAIVSIHCIGDTRMRRLNRQYRGRDQTTDVLAFAAHEGYVPAKNIRKGDSDWGDIFLCIPHIRRQARAYEVSFSEECTRMLAHGILHLLGYDHVTAREAKKMFGVQEQVVADQ